MIIPRFNIFWPDLDCHPVTGNRFSMPAQPVEEVSLVVMYFGETRPAAIELYL
jgi:hypothetical protein